MKYDVLASELDAYPQDRVHLYVAYLRKLEAEKKTGTQEIKNKWFPLFTLEAAVECFIKVQTTGVWLDGEDVMITWRGKPVITYNYTAYKNRVLSIYPEAKFYYGVVYEGDEFDYHFESDVLYWVYKPNNPLDTKKVIKGAYCAILTQRGQYMETIDVDDIEAFKQVSKMQGIWKAWLSEMVIKSILKRGCKRHFKDITVDMDKLDNEENYNLDLHGLPSSVSSDIEKLKTFVSLAKFYKKWNGKVPEEALIEKLTAQKKYLKSLLPEMKEEDIPKALELMSTGKSPKDLELVWRISDDIAQQLNDIEI